MIKKLFFVAIMLLIPINIFAQEIFKSISFNEACSLAQKEHKTIIIDFYTTWCGPCKALDRTTWRDKDVVKFLTDKVIPLKIDAEAQTDLASKFHITVYPTILFIKPDGNEMDRIVGYLEAAQFLDVAKSTIAGKDILTHTKEALEQNKNNPKLRVAYIEALSKKKLYKEAIEQYKVLIADHKDNIEYRIGYIDILFQDNQPKEAMAEYRDLMNENKNEPQMRLDCARRLAKIGQYKVSLDEYMHCYDHGAEESEYFQGMQRAVLVSIMGLANYYPPAKQTLIDRRDLLQQAILDNKATVAQVTNYIELNNTLKDPANMLEVFDKLKSQPQIRKLLFREVIKALLQAKRYNDVLGIAPDTLTEVKHHLKTNNDYIDQIKNDPNMDKSLIDENITNISIDSINIGSSYYEAALGANKMTLASQIADYLIDFYNTRETYNILIKRAKHVNANQQATELEERAAKSLPKN